MTFCNFESPMAKPSRSSRPMVKSTERVAQDEDSLHHVPHAKPPSARCRATSFLTAVASTLLIVFSSKVMARRLSWSFMALADPTNGVWLNRASLSSSFF